MGLSKLDNLYRRIILEHAAHPHHWGSLTGSTSAMELSNPTCGDVIKMEIKLEDDIIKDIAFSGHGCSISMASASMMTDVVIGKTKEEALECIQQFSNLVQGKEVDQEKRLKDAIVFSSISKFPARIKCSTLGWKAVGKILVEPITTIVESQPHCEIDPTSKI